MDQQVNTAELYLDIQGLCYSYPSSGSVVPQRDYVWQIVSQHISALVWPWLAKCLTSGCYRIAGALVISQYTVSITVTETVVGWIGTSVVPGVL